MTINKARYTENRDGAAMVIVLGLLGSLMLMGVAFAIYMRIERTGASNFRYGVQARHMVWAGIANAIEDIDGLMESGGTPDIFPEWDVACSTGGSARASVMSKAAAAHLPAGLRAAARAQSAKWQYINDGSTARGRYAFVIVNSSGFLDGNRVGGDPRCAGTDPFEIDISEIPGIDVNNFLTKRDADKRYETLPELVLFNRYVGDGSSFGVYSLTPIERRYSMEREFEKRVYIGPDRNLWDQSAIISALRACGVPNPGLAYSNLVNYVDADSNPGGSLDTGLVEKTPMLNEVICLYDITYDMAGNISGTANIALEWAYPFVTASQESFSMHVDVDVQAKSGNTVPAAVPLGLVSFDENISGGYIAPMTYSSVSRDSALPPASHSNATINVNFEVTISAYITGPSGIRVDEVPSPYNAAAGFKIPIVATVNRGQSISVTNYFECIDPRFNWVCAEGGGQWVSAADLVGVPPGEGHTVDAKNRVVDYFFTNPDQASYDLDDDHYMHITNSPLQSVGELGYICYDWWRTIRLYEHRVRPSPYPAGDRPYHHVLDYFTVHTNSYRRGLVNVNTTNLNVLASVFLNMPQQEYSVTTPPPLDWNKAQDLAYAIINEGPYTNLSELGKAGVSWDTLITPAPATEIRKESGIRNACELLTARENIFTIIIRADSFSDAMGEGMAADKGASLASARAIVEVWRDPIPDSNGKHKSLVRYFKYLED